MSILSWLKREHLIKTDAKRVKSDQHVRLHGDIARKNFTYSGKLCADIVIAGLRLTGPTRLTQNLRV